MSILCPDGHPFIESNSDGISRTDALNQWIRALKIGILNLMPIKLQSEMEIFNLLGSSSLQIDAHLIGFDSERSRNSQFDQFYMSRDQAQKEKFDAVIITGANVETKPFEKVSYWSQLKDVFDRSDTHSQWLMGLCWWAQAWLYHYHQIPKIQSKTKLFGVYDYHHSTIGHPLLKGMNDIVPMPVSCWTYNDRSAIEDCWDLSILLDSNIGPWVITDKINDRNHLWISGHPEYARGQLSKEWLRDCFLDSNVQSPQDYFLNSWWIEEFTALKLDEKIHIVMNLDDKLRDIIFSSAYFASNREILAKIKSYSKWSIDPKRAKVLTPNVRWSADAYRLFENRVTSVYRKTPEDWLD